MLRKFLFFLFDGRHHSSQTVGRGPCLTLCSPSFFVLFFLNCKCEATPLMDFQERNVVPLLCLIGFQLLSWVFFVFSFFCVFVCLFCFMVHQMFSVGETFRLQAGQFSFYYELRLYSNAVCGLTLSC